MSLFVWYGEKRLDTTTEEVENLMVIQGSKFKFEFGSTCATRCKFLGALPKF